MKIFRGWRFGAAGTINFDRPWVYSFAGAWKAFDRGFDTVESNTEAFSLLECLVDIPLGKRTMLRLGNQKEPINMDRSMTMTQLASHERHGNRIAVFARPGFVLILRYYFPVIRRISGNSFSTQSSPCLIASAAR